MQHVVDAVSAPPPNHLTAMTTDNASQSSASSPKSQKTLHDPNLSQLSESTLPSIAAHELTPPSSVASSREHDLDHQPTNGASVQGESATTVLAGKKRTANGQVKDTTRVGIGNVDGTPTLSDHARTGSTLSQTNTANVGEISQQLKTKLTYAMLKVQNGWQKHSLDEIESIASQSPRSVITALPPREYQPLVSPRPVLATSVRHNSDASSSSGRSSHHQPNLASVLSTEPVASLSNKALAPPAPIMPGNRRRPTSLHVNSVIKPSLRPNRPATTQRTPSQNAAMEADAVETLLFMSASPNNSGHFPAHLSTYSPLSQAFSTQNTPLKSHFSPIDRALPSSAIRYSPQRSYRRSRYEDKSALIDRLLHDLDDSDSEELDRALEIMEQHHAAKLSA